MKKLFKMLALYLVLALVVGELISRLFYLTADIPELTIENNIQKYLPNQNGYHEGGGHKWQINKRGWAGPLPQNFENLITIIGDSYIENFMNPDECHQSYYLKEMLPENNFLEAARSGVSLIEAMEISKHLDSLRPKHQLIYLSDNDFEESITEISRQTNITQVSLKDRKILHGKTKSPLLKKIIYNWKFIYYLYRRFPINLNQNIEQQPNVNNQNRTSADANFDIYVKLMDFIVENYKVDEIVFVLRPSSSNNLMQIVKKYNIKAIFLDDQGEDWELENDHHWSCFGHSQAAKQVVPVLELF